MKNLLSAGAVFLVLFTSAQKMQVQNMYNYLRNKEYVKAIEAADLAIKHPQTSDEPKTWKYRGDIFKAIYSDTSKAVRDIDLEAEEKALEAYIRCLELDQGKDIYKDDVKGPLVLAAGAQLGLPPGTFYEMIGASLGYQVRLCVPGNATVERGHTLRQKAGNLSLRRSAMSRMQPLLMKPATPRLRACSDMLWPKAPVLLSRPSSITSTSPGSSIVSALCVVMLSSG